MSPTRAGIPEPVDNLGELEGYHSAQVEVAVRMNTNESPLPPPDEWRDAVAEEVRRLPFHRYPDRSARRLRMAIADFHGLSAENVFVGNGSNEVLQTLFLTYGGHGRAAAVFEPTYAMHSQIGRVTSTEIVVGERQPDFTLDLVEVKRVTTDAAPSLTFLCSPNNPTGRCEPPEVVSEVLQLATGLVVVDEAYGQFSKWSAIDQVGDDVPLVVVRTFSKTWAMAGFRLGYLLAAPVVVAELEKRVLPYHLDALKQAAGIAALRFPVEMEARVKALVSERERVFAALASLRVEAWPSEANFILFRPLDREGGEVWQALVDRSVLIRDCTTWPRLAGCLRVTIGTNDENDRFLDALTKVLR